MASVFRGQSLAFENVTQMPATILTEDFDPVAVSVSLPPHSTFDFIVEARPAAAGLKLVLRLIQWCIAATTDVRSGCFIVEQFAGAGTFRTLSQNDPLFFGIELIVLSHSVVSDSVRHDV